MADVDLIPGVFRLTGAAVDNGDAYRSAKFNVGKKNSIGITVKASQALSVAIAYGRDEDTAAASGQASSASLPFKTAATSFASEATATEGGTYHELTMPPMAQQAQLVISNASGSNVTGAVIDAALRNARVAASGGGGGSPAIADITDWPSGLSATELGYVNGVTSAIQTQLDAKAPLADTPTTVTTTATISAAYTRCNHASTPFTVTLPAASGSGVIYTIKNIGVAAVTVEGDSSDTLDGAANVVLAQYSSITVRDAASGAWDIV